MQWAYYNFPNVLNTYIWKLKCQQRQTNKTKIKTNLVCKLFFPNSTEKPLSKIAPANSNSSAFLFGATKMKIIMLRQPAVLFTNCQKILLISCVWTLKILYTNKRTLT